MKKKYQALKMYLVGLTAGLFMFGWSLVAQSGNTLATTAQATTANTAQTTTAQTTTKQTSTTVQTSTTNRRTTVTQPTFRTRTS